MKPGSVRQLPPPRSQRSHWNENVIGCVPVHVPGVARSVSFTAGVPEIVGRDVFRGRDTAARTTSVAFDATVVAPSLFEAVTRARSRLPTSPFASTYADVVAPPMAAQSAPSDLPPDGGQRTH